MRYADILTIAERIRHSIQRGGNIFWTSDDITNGQQIAESMGSWSVTNTVYNNAPYGITNVQVRTYSYSTNSFKDMIVTSGRACGILGACSIQGWSGRIHTDKDEPAHFQSCLWKRATVTCLTNAPERVMVAVPKDVHIPWEQWNDVDRIR